MSHLLSEFRSVEHCYMLFASDMYRLLFIGEKCCKRITNMSILQSEIYVRAVYTPYE